MSGPASDESDGATFTWVEPGGQAVTLTCGLRRLTLSGAGALRDGEIAWSAVHGIRRADSPAGERADLVLVLPGREVLVMGGGPTSAADPVETMLYTRCNAAGTLRGQALHDALVGIRAASPAPTPQARPAPAFLAASTDLRTPSAVRTIGALTIRTSLDGEQLSWPERARRQAPVTRGVVLAAAIPAVALGAGGLGILGITLAWVFAREAFIDIAPALLPALALGVAGTAILGLLGIAIQAVRSDDPGERRRATLEVRRQGLRVGSRRIAWDALAGVRVEAKPVDAGPPVADLWLLATPEPLCIGWDVPLATAWRIADRIEAARPDGIEDPNDDADAELALAVLRGRASDR